MNAENVIDETLPRVPPFQHLLERSAPEDMRGRLSSATVGSLVYEARKRDDKLTGIPRTVHELKCWSTVFPYVLTGEKNFEVRRNDRDFHRGDVLLLREWDSTGQFYTDRSVRVIVTYVMRGSEKNAALTNGFVVMGVRLFDEP